MREPFELAGQGEFRRTSGNLKRWMASHAAARLQFLDIERDVVAVPQEVADLVAGILAQLAAGRFMAAYPIDAELAPQQVADFLNVSRPHVIKLVNEGIIHHHKVRTHRRLCFTDVLACRVSQDEEGRTALDDLSRVCEELGPTTTSHERCAPPS